jgi:hypothetical protein
MNGWVRPRITHWITVSRVIVLIAVLVSTCPSAAVVSKTAATHQPAPTRWQHRKAVVPEHRVPAASRPLADPIANPTDYGATVDTILIGRSFEGYATLANDGTYAGWGGVSISFPKLTAEYFGLIPGGPGPYDTYQGKGQHPRRHDCVADALL